MSDCYSSPDYAALLAAVKAAPDDDLPRLVMADRLDEWGEHDRAELIRVHLAYYAAKHNHRHQSFGGEPCRKCKLKRRLKKLWHLPEDGLPFGVWGRLPQGGFITAVDCSAAAWLAHGDALLAREPVTNVTLTTWPDWECRQDRSGWVIVGDPKEERLSVPHGEHIDHSRRGIAEILLAARWPGVTFTLPEPEAEAAAIRDELLADFTAIRDRAMDAVARSLAVPAHLVGRHAFR